jgi:peptidoglycan-N-acetylglucosamine deacetylase
MFNYRNTNLTFLLVIILVIATGQLSGYWWFMVIGVLILLLSWLTILTLGAFKIGWNFYFFSYSHGDRSVPEVALTFDDGPDAEVTPKILEILEKYKVRATFFCIGKKIGNNPEIFKEIVSPDHEFGNHTYSHSSLFDLFSVKKMVKEILKTDDAIEKLYGHKPGLFRPPYGVTNPALRKALKKTGHVSVSWSVRSFDTVRKPETVLKKINKNVKNGDIILFHDNRPGTPVIVEEFIRHSLEKGRKFVSVGELLKIEPYKISD